MSKVLITAIKVFAFVSALAYGQEYEDSRIVSCVINDIDGKHNYKKESQIPLIFGRERYSDGLGFDLLFEGYSLPRNSDPVSSIRLGAIREFERSTSPHIYGREQYCEVVKTSPAVKESESLKLIDK